MGNNELKTKHQWKFVTAIGLVVILLGVLLNCASCGKVETTYGHLRVRNRDYIGGVESTEYGRWVVKQYDVKKDLNVSLRNTSDLTLNVTEVQEDIILVNFSTPIYQVDVGKTVDSITLIKGTSVSFITGDTTGLEVELEYED